MLMQTHRHVSLVKTAEVCNARQKQLQVPTKHCAVHVTPGFEHFRAQPKQGRVCTVGAEIVFHKVCRCRVICYCTASSYCIAMETHTRTHTRAHTLCACSALNEVGQEYSHIKQNQGAASSQIKIIETGLSENSSHI